MLPRVRQALITSRVLKNWFYFCQFLIGFLGEKIFWALHFNICWCLASYFFFLTCKAFLYLVPLPCSGITSWAWLLLLGGRCLLGPHCHLGPPCARRLWQTEREVAGRLGRFRATTPGDASYSLRGILINRCKQLRIQSVLTVLCSVLKKTDVSCKSHNFMGTGAILRPYEFISSEQW